MCSSQVVLDIKNLPAGDLREVGKIPCRRAWQTTPEFLPREPHGQEEPGGPWGHTESDSEVI